MVYRIFRNYEYVVEWKTIKKGNEANERNQKERKEES